MDENLMRCLSAEMLMAILGLVLRGATLKQVHALKSVCKLWGDVMLHIAHDSTALSVDRAIGRVTAGFLPLTPSGSRVWTDEAGDIRLEYPDIDVRLDIRIRCEDADRSFNAMDGPGGHVMFQMGLDLITIAYDNNKKDMWLADVHDGTDPMDPEYQVTPCGLIWHHTDGDTIAVYDMPGNNRFWLDFPGYKFVHWVAPKVCIIGVIGPHVYRVTIPDTGDESPTGVEHPSSMYTPSPGAEPVDSFVANGDLLCLQTSSGITVHKYTPAGYTLVNEISMIDHDFKAIHTTEIHTVCVRTTDTVFSARVYADGQLLCQKNMPLLGHGATRFNLVGLDVVALVDPTCVYALLSNPLR
jgi:hypothetical protein